VIDVLMNSVVTLTSTYGLAHCMYEEKIKSISFNWLVIALSKLAFISVLILTDLFTARAYIWTIIISQAMQTVLYLRISDHGYKHILVSLSEQPWIGMFQKTTYSLAARSIHISIGMIPFSLALSESAIFLKSSSMDFNLGLWGIILQV